MGVARPPEQRLSAGATAGTLMPEMKDDEIREAIAKGLIQGFAIDTAVFDRYGCNLHYAVLTSLDQFKGKSIRLLLSEIVRDEVTAHIAKDAADTQRKLKDALNQHLKAWKLPKDAGDRSKLALDVDPHGYAASQVQTYLEQVGANVVPAIEDATLAREALRRYFASEVPFEKKEAKKSEFPDAFALLSLDANARVQKSLTLCVSPDKGWRAFCAKSENLVCVADINAALAFFNSSGRKTAEDVLALWRDGKASALAEEVERAFEYALDTVDFGPDADMPTNFDVEPVSAVMQYPNLESVTAPIIISADDEKVTFTIKLEALVAFEAEFHSYVRDSIDGDNVPLGSATATTEQTLTFELVITVSRQIDPEPEPLDVEVAPPRLSIHFGHVDPFPDEDPTHEKY
jgi:hypothetical protein